VRVQVESRDAPPWHYQLRTVGESQSKLNANDQLYAANQCLKLLSLQNQRYVNCNDLPQN